MSEPTSRAPDLAERAGKLIADTALKPDGYHGGVQGINEDDAAEIIRTVLRDSVERGELAGVREALEEAQAQLAVGRRYLPTHGSFGEDGLDAYEAAQESVRRAIERLGGEKP